MEQRTFTLTMSFFTEKVGMILLNSRSTSVALVCNLGCNVLRLLDNVIERE
jgi:hypothetical protein